MVYWLFKVEQVLTKGLGLKVVGLSWIKTLNDFYYSACFYLVHYCKLVGWISFFQGWTFSDEKVGIKKRPYVDTATQWPTVGPEKSEFFSTVSKQKKKNSGMLM